MFVIVSERSFFYSKFTAVPTFATRAAALLVPYITGIASLGCKPKIKILFNNPFPPASFIHNCKANKKNTTYYFELLCFRDLLRDKLARERRVIIAPPAAFYTSARL